MTVVWIVIGLVVVVAALLVVLEVQNARRRKALAHLEPVDPRVGERAMSEASGSTRSSKAWRSRRTRGSAAPGAARSAEPPRPGGCRFRCTVLHSTPDALVRFLQRDRTHSPALV